MDPSDHGVGRNGVAGVAGKHSAAGEAAAGRVASDGEATQEVDLRGRVAGGRHDSGGVHAGTGGLRSFLPAEPLPAVPSQVEGSGTPQPPSRQPRRSGVLLVTAVVLAAVLLAISVAHAVLIVVMTARVNDQAASLRETGVSVSETNDRLDRLDRRTKSSMNSAAIAERALPSVFSFFVGDVPGTAFVIGTADTGTTLMTTATALPGLGSGQQVNLVSSERKTVKATVGRIDRRRNLAVLTAVTPSPALAASRSSVLPGDPVLMISTAERSPGTVNTGVVSAIREGLPGATTTLIQSDLPFNIGNSGGPLINRDGQVVGIASANAAAAEDEQSEGISLAVPVSEICKGMVQC